MILALFQVYRLSSLPGFRRGPAHCSSSVITVGASVRGRAWLGHRPCCCPVITGREGRRHSVPSHRVTCPLVGPTPQVERRQTQTGDAAASQRSAVEMASQPRKRPTEATELYLSLVEQLERRRQKLGWPMWKLDELHGRRGGPGMRVRRDRPDPGPAGGEFWSGGKARI
jgi:hypothetical protein